MRKGDDRQLDLLDWLDEQLGHSHRPAKPQLRATISGENEVDEDQLDLEDLIAATSRAA